MRATRPTVQTRVVVDDLSLHRASVMTTVAQELEQESKCFAAKLTQAGREGRTELWHRIYVGRAGFHGGATGYISRARQADQEDPRQVFGPTALRQRLAMIARAAIAKANSPRSVLHGEAAAWQERLDGAESSRQLV